MPTSIFVSVQTETLNSQTLEQHLNLTCAVGALVTFIGIVRDHGDRPDVVGLRLEHYAGMTEKILRQSCQHAAERWPLASIVLVHRIGALSLGEPIMGIAVASAHRQDAFDAIQFLMDFLKNDAPFWKQEITQSGDIFWVEQKTSDQNAKNRW
jgi:molybdopterin synthase catalytic subunit